MGAKRLLNARVCVLACVLGLLCGRAPGATTQEYLIAERPAMLWIFNRYQQQLSADERSRLLPFTPFRIIEAHDVMGDGFTPCMKVEAQGVLYYLQKNEQGGLLGASSAGRIERIQHAVALNDTIELTDSRGTPLRDPGNTRRHSLARGSIVIRIFATGDETYVYAVALQRYGWVRLEKSDRSRHWRQIKPELRLTFKSVAHVLPAIEERVAEVNDKLRRLFEHLSVQSDRPVAPPQWSVRPSETSILCVLETSLPVQHFDESSRLLARRLEGALLGTKLRVEVSAGFIRVW